MHCMNYKKNAKQVILAVMLTSIGDSIVDVAIDQKEVFEALNFLLNKVSLKKK
jgi:3-dehydroquinate synthetase